MINMLWMLGSPLRIASSISASLSESIPCASGDDTGHSQTGGRVGVCEGVAVADGPAVLGRVTVAVGAIVFVGDCGTGAVAAGALI